MAALMWQPAAAVATKLAWLNTVKFTKGPSATDAGTLMVHLQFFTQIIQTGQVDVQFFR